MTIQIESKHIPVSRIEEGKSHLYETGGQIEKAWLEMDDHHPHVQPEDYVVMPDHFHGILHILHYPLKGPTVLDTGSLRFGTLGVVINQFKGAVTKWCRVHGIPDYKWQAGYYDRILRREKEIELVRKYIEANPSRWQIRNNRGA